jgi:cell division protein FtsB
VIVEQKVAKCWVLDPTLLPILYLAFVIASVQISLLISFPEFDFMFLALFADSMDDFAADLSKIVSEKKLAGGAGKAGKKRKLATKGSAVFGSGSSSPGGASCSSLGTKLTSPRIPQKTKLIKEEAPIIDLEIEKPFLLPRLITDKEFLEKNPLQVAAAEKAAILGADEDTGRERILKDSAGLLRMLEMVLVLHDERGNRLNDLEKLKSDYGKLEAENMKLENEVVDLRGKKENFVAAAKENRELKEEVAKFAEEKKKLEGEVELLKSAMAPAEDEIENTRDLSTRVDFVGRVRKLGDSVLAGVKHGWQNALAQIKVANPGAELSFEGMGVFREVVDGQIILPEKYKEVEAAELAGEDDMDDDGEEEEDDGSSKKTSTPEDED